MQNEERASACFPAANLSGEEISQLRIPDLSNTAFTCPEV